MTKWLGMLSVIILLAPIASAEPFTELVFDGWALENTIYPGIANFTVQFGNEDKIIVEVGGERILAANNTCQEGQKFIACNSGFELSHYNYSLAQRVVNKAKVKIDLMVTKLNITREMPSELLIGQQYSIKTTVKNIGEKDATGITFQDSYPKEIDVYSNSDCEVLQSNVSKKMLRLESGGRFTCSYTIKPLKSVLFTSTAKVDYNNGAGQKSEESAAAVSVPPYSLAISYNLTNSSPDLGQEIELNISIIALKNLTVEYFRVKLPEGLRAIKTDNAFSKSGDMLTYRGKLENGQGLLFNNKFQAELFGVREFELSTRITVSGFTQDFNEKIPVNVSFDKPFVRLSRTSFAKNRDKLIVYVTNPSGHDINEVTLTMSGMLAANRTEQKIEGRSHRDYTFEFNRPDGEYELSTFLMYKTEYNQRLSEKKDHEITIETEKKIVEQNDTENISAPVTEEKVSLDVGKGIKRTGNVFLVLAGVVVLIIILGIAATKLRRGTSPPEPKEETKASLDELKEAFKQDENK